MLRGLDFSLFELTPLQGRYIVGFGQAFDIDLEVNRFEHVAKEEATQQSKSADCQASSTPNKTSQNYLGFTETCDG